MKFYPISSPVDAKFNNIQPEELPSVLFERTMNMEGLQREFSKVLLLPKKKREKWIESNKEMILSMLDQIKKEGQIVIKSMSIDKVMKQTIVEYMVVLQDTLVTLEKVVQEMEQPVD